MIPAPPAKRPGRARRPLPAIVIGVTTTPWPGLLPALLRNRLPARVRQLHVTFFLDTTSDFRLPPRPQTSLDRIADDLAELVRAVGIPVVLVTRGYGALIVHRLALRDHALVREHVAATEISAPPRSLAAANTTGWSNAGGPALTSDPQCPRGVLAR
ncbi:alpha/beta fold hydrolase [Nocardia blacklockiae]|uniref:alpha/beta fold hydrolase n=1 Tax=Nocardia blacklockiae TaxID=480036 RepID=UPI0018956649|nr:hypothetical protein [Nocardia blacklockiae]MBF6171144.1 hypothetical protein [Nocardia blacklockiae]